MVLPTLRYSGQQLLATGYRIARKHFISIGFSTETFKPTVVIHGAGGDVELEMFNWFSIAAKDVGITACFQTLLSSYYYIDEGVYVEIHGEAGEMYIRAAGESSGGIRSEEWRAMMDDSRYFQMLIGHMVLLVGTVRDYYTEYVAMCATTGQQYLTTDSFVPPITGEQTPSVNYVRLFHDITFVLKHIN